MHYRLDHYPLHCWREFRLCHLSGICGSACSLRRRKANFRQQLHLPLKAGRQGRSLR